MKTPHYDMIPPCEHTIGVLEVNGVRTYISISNATISNEFRELTFHGQRLTVPYSGKPYIELSGIVEQVEYLNVDRDHNVDYRDILRGAFEDPDYLLSED
jgi:hypothetical protein